MTDPITFEIEKVIPQHVEGETPTPLYAAKVWTEKDFTDAQKRTFVYPQPPPNWKYAIISFMKLEPMTAEEILAAQESK